MKSIFYDSSTCKVTSDFLAISPSPIAYYHTNLTIAAVYMHGIPQCDAQHFISSVMNEPEVISISIFLV